jgi:hypothetical protein
MHRRPLDRARLWRFLNLAFTAALIHPEGGMYRVVLLALFFMQADARPSQSLQLRIEAPPELAAVRKRLESIDPQRFTDIAQLLGLTDVGPAIRVALVPESSDLARGVSPWIAGFTTGESAVIFPARSPLSQRLSRRRHAPRSRPRADLANICGTARVGLTRELRWLPSASAV